jgi:hypothetical protein
MHLAVPRFCPSLGPVSRWLQGAIADRRWRSEWSSYNSAKNSVPHRTGGRRSHLPSEAVLQECLQFPYELPIFSVLPLEGYCCKLTPSNNLRIKKSHGLSSGVREHQIPASTQDLRFILLWDRLFQVYSPNCALFVCCELCHHEMSRYFERHFLADPYFTWRHTEIQFALTTLAHHLQLRRYG